MTMFLRGLVFLLLSGMVFSSWAEEPKTLEQRFSYAIGYTFARQMKQQPVQLDAAMLSASIDDAMSDRPARMTEEEMTAAITEGKQAIVDARKETARRNLEQGNKFLEKNKQEPGVVTLPSGLQYAELQAGKGNPPGLNDTVAVHYRGTFIDGREFDNSHRHGDAPINFRPEQVIPGFREALTKMKPGSKWRIFVPSELAYGAEGMPPGIPPNTALIFDIDLVSIQPAMSGQAQGGSAADGSGK
jgi:FKBP-type peptidyl-prolyl cis-trans isomerase FklB